jgi:hypothetical protein
VAIPFDKLRVQTNINESYMVFYLPMTEEQLANAPRVQENDTSWLSNDDRVAQNEEYYDSNIGEG